MNGTKYTDYWAELFRRDVERYDGTIASDSLRDTLQVEHQNKEPESNIGIDQADAQIDCFAIYGKNRNLSFRVATMVAFSSSDGHTIVALFDVENGDIFLRHLRKLIESHHAVYLGAVDEGYPPKVVLIDQVAGFEGPDEPVSAFEVSSAVLNNRMQAEVRVKNAEAKARVAAARTRSRNRGKTSR